MHIPDGYLSPATCVVGYAIMIPFWATAVKKVKAALNTKLIPLMVIGAAFSFVLMMFNVPIPGGTTAHAVGSGVLAVILGPWAATICTSIALAIQALLFGDGGIIYLWLQLLQHGPGDPLCYLLYLPMRLPANRRSRHPSAGSGPPLAATSVSTWPLPATVPSWACSRYSGIPRRVCRYIAPYPITVSVPAMLLAHALDGRPG